MIRLPSTILVALAPVDLHFSFDRLVGIVRHELGADPKADTVVVFHNRRRTHVKLLWHDGSGYVVLYKRLDCATFRVDEVAEPLRHRRLDVRVVARAEHHHEQLDLGDLARVSIHDLRLLAGVVHKRLLAGAVRLSHRRREFVSKARVEVAELAVLVRPRHSRRLGERLLVLEPETLERDAVSTQLAMDPDEIDWCARTGLVATNLPEQPTLHLCVAQLLSSLPRELGLGRSRQVLADRALADRARRRNRAMAEPALELES